MQRTTVPGRSDASELNLRTDAAHTAVSRLGKMFRTMFLAESICGGVVLVLGIVLYRVGVFQRKRATEAVTAPVTVTPLLGPGLAGVNIGGRF